MKVLTSDVVQDPTKVEARVRREVAQRKIGHEKMNEERKLTDEQRREKLEQKKTEEEKKGLYGAVYKYVDVFHLISLERCCVPAQLLNFPLFLGSRISAIHPIGSKFARTQSRWVSRA